MPPSSSLTSSSPPCFFPLSDHCIIQFKLAYLPHLPVTALVFCCHLYWLTCPSLRRWVSTPPVEACHCGDEPQHAWSPTTPMYSRAQPVAPREHATPHAGRSVWSERAQSGRDLLSKCNFVTPQCCPAYISIAWQLIGD